MLEQRRGRASFGVWMHSTVRAMHLVCENCVCRLDAPHRSRLPDAPRLAPLHRHRRSAVASPRDVEPLETEARSSSRGCDQHWRGTSVRL